MEDRKGNGVGFDGAPQAPRFLVESGYLAPFHAVMRRKGNVKREIKQVRLLLPPARSSKGNVKRGSRGIMLPFRAVMRRKGNVKREIEQVRLPLPPARSSKGNVKREIKQVRLRLTPARSSKGNVKRENRQNPLPFPRSTKINEEKSAKSVAFVNEPCYTECVIGNQDFL